MQIRSHKPKSKWYSPTFTLSQVPREVLSLILALVEDGILSDRSMSDHDGKCHPKRYEDILDLVKLIDGYINSDETTRHMILDIDPYNGLTPNEWKEEQL